MTKKKSTGTMVTARVKGILRSDNDTGILFDYAEHRAPFTVYFEIADDDLDIDDLVTVTIMKSEVQDG